MPRAVSSRFHQLSLGARGAGLSSALQGMTRASEATGLEAGDPGENLALVAQRGPPGAPRIGYIPLLEVLCSFTFNHNINMNHFLFFPT